MNKKFKRLISVILTVMMAIGMMPFSGLTTVSAADTNTVYFDNSGANWSNVNIVAWNANNQSVAYFRPMTKVGDTNVYKYELSSDATKIVFTKKTSWTNEAKSQTVDLKTSDWADKVFKINGTEGAGYLTKYTGYWESYSGGSGGDVPGTSTTVYFTVDDSAWINAGVGIKAWNTGGSSKDEDPIAMTRVSGTNYFYYDLGRKYDNVVFAKGATWDNNVQTVNLEIPWNTYSKPCFTVTYIEGTNCTGTWSKYTNGTVLSERYWAPTDLVDYFNDNRVGDGPNFQTDNQGNNETDNNWNAFSQLDKVIMDEGYSMPLYFGDMYKTNKRYAYDNGNNVYFNTDSKNWSTGANVAHGDDGTASAQGLVGTKLVNGNLVDPGDSSKELMYFSQNAKYDNVRAYYKDKEFPFKQTYDADSDVTTYSYDSEKDYAVYYDYTNKKLVESNYHSKNSTGGTNGYYPFDYQNVRDNKNTAHSADVNMGTGTKFTIPFTLPKSGTVGNDNTPAVFEFTGDDDVWVFIDDYLVLDMGGAHHKSSGQINFADGTATVDKAYTPKIGWGDYGRVNDDGTYHKVSKSVTNFADISVGEGKTLADLMKDETRVHTLTMFYMERGMFDSNMSISFTMEVIPSGLSLQKSIEDTTVNSGLKDSLENTDAFDFAITQNNTALGNDVTYRKDRADETTSIDNGKVVGLKNLGIADTFKKNGADFLTPGDTLRIVEEIPENLQYRYTTKTTITNLNDSSNPVTKESKDTDNFAFGNAGDASANYNVSYVNTVLTGDITLKKEWSTGNANNTDSYDFYVGIDLTGGTEYQSYYVEYTVDGGAAQIADGGKITLKPGQTATIAGVPIGATYQIQEVLPENTAAVLKSVTVNGTAVTPENGAITGKVIGATGSETVNATQAVVFTNAPQEVTLDKVIYVEAGTKKNYTPSELSSAGYESLTAETSGIEVDINAKTFHIPEANQKHTVSYTGSKTDGTKVKGTITVYSYKATDQVYVFDYGLKSNIAATNGKDGLFEGGVFNNAYATGDDKATATLGAVTGDTSNSQTAITASGDLTIKDDNSITGSVTFEPKAFMDKAENYSYTANIKKDSATALTNNPETGTVVNGTIKVMPASVVYYEDNFNAGTETSDNSVKIIYTGSVDTSDTAPTIEQSNSQTEQYGHDGAYATGTGDSAGSSTKLTADGYNTKATFTFTGTGFDILARTTTDTAGIVCIIEKEGQTNPVEVIAVDTYYANGDLYQIPVIHKEGLEHGKYTVTLGITANAAKNKTVVYLDGIRIYNPLGTTGDAGYIDNEEGATVSKVSSLILGDGTVTEKGVINESGEAVVKAQDIPGASAALLTEELDDENKLFHTMGTTRMENIGGDTSTTNNSLLAYLEAGPNNEIYLGEESYLAFVVSGNPTDQATTLQIEAKLLDADGNNDSLDLNVVGGDTDYTDVCVSTINTSTAMYYQIPVENTIKLSDNKYLVVIKGSEGETSGGQRMCLSFSNLKYNGYTIINPLQDNDAMAYIANDSSNSAFTSFDFSLKSYQRNKWYDTAQKMPTLVLNNDVFNGKSAKFEMYYVAADGKETKISTYTHKVKDKDNTYQLEFKTPKATGTFDIRVYYVVDGQKSTEFIAGSMTVTK